MTKSITDVLKRTSEVESTLTTPNLPTAEEQAKAAEEQTVKAAEEQTVKAAEEQAKAAEEQTVKDAEEQAKAAEEQTVKAAEEQAKAAEEQTAVITAYNGNIESSFNDSEKSPADWAITQGYAEDLIIATHRVTRKVFSGTVKQLCQALK